jgi:hypothetical protein
MLWPLRNAPAVTRETEEDWGRQHMMDPWGRELFLICLLAAFCGALAWVLGYGLFTSVLPQPRLLQFLSLAHSEAVGG